MAIPTPTIQPPPEPQDDSGGISALDAGGLGVLGAGGLGAATFKPIQMPRRMLASKLLSQARPGDILLSGEYAPAAGKGLSGGKIWKALKRKGIDRKMKALKLAMKEGFGNYHIRGASTISGSPFYHGGILGSGAKHGQRPVYHMTTEATKEQLIDFLSSGDNRVALYRPDVPRKQVHKALAFAEKAVQKGMGYDTVGSILTHAKRTLPGPVYKHLANKAKTMPPKAFCTNFPMLMYEAAGAKLTPGLAAGSVIPLDILRSKKLKPVGWTGKALSGYERFKYLTLPRAGRALKYGLYGGLGAGAAAGLYHLLKDKEPDS